MRKLVCTACVLLVGSMMLLTGCDSNNAYDYELSQYVKVGQYEDLRYSRPDDIKISQSAVEKAISSELEGAKYLKDVSDGLVHDGDTVNIDYEGTIDGKIFEGGSAEGQVLVIGSNSLIEGFEKGLIGEKVGDKVSLDLTFPQNYKEESLQGRDVIFEVKINASREYVIPSEKKFVKDSGLYDSVDDYEKAVKKRLYEAEEAQQKMDIESELWDKVMDESELIKIPEKELNEYVEQAKKSVQDFADENGMEFIDVIQSYYNMDEKSFYAQIKKEAEKNCFNQMVAYSIAREQGIKVSGDEYDKFIEEQLKEVGYTEEEFEKHTGSSYEEYVGGKSYIYYYLHYQKVLDYIRDKARAE